MNIYSAILFQIITLAMLAMPLQAQESLIPIATTSSDMILTFTIDGSVPLDGIAVAKTDTLATAVSSNPGTLEHPAIHTSIAEAGVDIRNYSSTIAIFHTVSATGAESVSIEPLFSRAIAVIQSYVASLIAPLVNTPMNVNWTFNTLNLYAGSTSAFTYMANIIDIIQQSATELKSISIGFFSFLENGKQSTGFIGDSTLVTALKNWFDNNVIQVGDQVSLKPQAQDFNIKIPLIVSEDPLLLTINNTHTELSYEAPPIAINQIGEKAGHIPSLGENNALHWDVATGTLSFDRLAINTLTNALNKEYPDDPLRGGFLEIDPLQLISSDTGHQYFSGKELRLIDNQGAVIYRASLPSLVFDDTLVAKQGFTIFAPILNVLEANPNASIWLQNYLAKNNPSSIFLSELFIGFAIKPSVGDIWQKNFDTSVTSVLSFSGVIPDSVNPDSVNKEKKRRAVIVEGYANSPELKLSFKDNAKFAYDVLMQQGYSEEDIYYLSSSNATGVDDVPSASNVELAISQWNGIAGDTEDLIIYLIADRATIDTKSGILLSATNGISLEQMNTWITTRQSSATFNNSNGLPYSGLVTLIFDACRSGDIVSDPISGAISPLRATNRLLISSTSSMGAAHFTRPNSSDSNANIASELSFSRVFWQNIRGGQTVFDAFMAAGNAVNLVDSGQIPQLDDNFNGQGNDAGDVVMGLEKEGVLSKKISIGAATVSADEVPRIIDHTASGENNGGNISLNVTVATNNAIVDVWAIITRPDHSQRCDTDNLLPKLHFTQDPKNPDHWLAEYTKLDVDGDYHFTFYAVDNGKQGTQQAQQSAPVSAVITHKSSANPSSSNSIDVGLYEPNNNAHEATPLLVSDIDSQGLPLKQTQAMASAHDEDWMVFYAQKDKNYAFSLSAVGADIDVGLQLFNDQGESVQQLIDAGFNGKDEYVEWRAISDGFYFIRVTNRGQSVGTANTYQVYVSLPQAPAQGLFKGIIHDQCTGAALKDVTIAIPATHDKTLSFIDGSYGLSLPADPAAQTYKLDFSAADYQLLSVSRTLHSLSVVPLDIDLSPIKECPLQSSDGTVANPPPANGTDATGVTPPDTSTGSGAGAIGNAAPSPVPTDGTGAIGKTAPDTTAGNGNGTANNAANTIPPANGTSTDSTTLVDTSTGSGGGAVGNAAPNPVPLNGTGTTGITTPGTSTGNGSGTTNNAANTTPPANGTGTAGVTLPDISMGSGSGVVDNVANATLNFAPVNEPYPAGTTPLDTSTDSSNVPGMSEYTAPDTIPAGGEAADSVLDGGVSNSIADDISYNKTFKANETLIGGTLAGIIQGIPNAPALLSNVKVFENAQLSQVIIGNGTSMAVSTYLGQGVKFSDNALIPNGINLSDALPHISTDGQPVAINLMTDVLVDVNMPDLLQQIQKITSLSGFNITQNSSTGSVMVHIDNQYIALRPFNVAQTHVNEAPGVSFTAEGLIRIVTASGRVITFAGELYDVLGFKQTLAQLSLTVGLIDSRGSFTVVPQDQTASKSKHYYVARPDFYSEAETIADQSGLYFKAQSDLANIYTYYHVFSEDGLLKQKALYPIPVDWESLKSSLEKQQFIGVRLNAQGIIQAEKDQQRYRGLMDYLVYMGVEAGALRFDSAGDLNGDGMDDVMVIYPNGHRQALFLYPIESMR